MVLFSPDCRNKKYSNYSAINANQRVESWNLGYWKVFGFSQIENLLGTYFVAPLSCGGGPMVGPMCETFFYEKIIRFTLSISDMIYYFTKRLIPI